MKKSILCLYLLGGLAFQANAQSLTLAEEEMAMRQRNDNPSLSGPRKATKVAPQIATPAAPVQAQLYTPPPPDKIDMLRQVSDDLGQALKYVEQGNLEYANSHAKMVADRVTQEIGKDPQAELQDVINSNAGLTFADLKKDFSQLTNQQRNDIILAVKAYRHGQFLDLINLYKRAKLIEIQAEFATLLREAQNKAMVQSSANIKKQKPRHQPSEIGVTLESQDRADLVRALKSIYAISIFVGASNLEPFMVFDVDVASRDHQKWFQREIRGFIDASTPYLVSGGQAEFLATVEADKAARLQSYRAGLAPTQVLPPQGPTWDVSLCINAESILEIQETLRSRNLGHLPKLADAFSLCQLPNMKVFNDCLSRAPSNQVISHLYRFSFSDNAILACAQNAEILHLLTNPK